MLKDRIRQLRKALGLSQTAFGKKIGTHHSSISEWKNGKVEIKESSLRRIELTFNVNPDWLRDGIGEMFWPALEEDAAKVVDWLKSLSNKDQIWASKEIERQIPELKKWLENNL